MTEMLLDTQKMVERLEAAGVPPAQARAFTAVLLDAISSADAHYASRYVEKDELAQALAELKAEIKQLETRMNAGFAEIRAEMTAGLSSLRSDLIRWVVTVGILQTTLITALVLKLVP